MVVCALVDAPDPTPETKYIGNVVLVQRAVSAQEPPWYKHFGVGIRFFFVRHRPVILSPLVCTVLVYIHWCAYHRLVMIIAPVQKNVDEPSNHRRYCTVYLSECSTRHKHHLRWWHGQHLDNLIR